MQIIYDKYMRNVINIALPLSLSLASLASLVERACVCELILISTAQDGT